MKLQDRGKCCRGRCREHACRAAGLGRKRRRAVAEGENRRRWYTLPCFLSLWIAVTRRRNDSVQVWVLAFSLVQSLFISFKFKNNTHFFIIDTIYFGKIAHSLENKYEK